MDILIDIDGTIVDAVTKFVKANRDKCTFLPWKYDLDERFYPGAMKDVIDYLEKGGDEIVYPGVFESIDKLLRSGHDVQIISARSVKSLESFKKKYPKYEHLVTPKKDIIGYGDKYDILIDDHPEKELIDIVEKIFIIDHDYNRNDYKKYQRYKSLKEIVDTHGLEWNIHSSVEYYQGDPYAKEMFKDIVRFIGDLSSRVRDLERDDVPRLMNNIDKIKEYQTRDNDITDLKMTDKNKLNVAQWRGDVVWIVDDIDDGHVTERELVDRLKYLVEKIESDMKSRKWLEKESKKH